MHFRKRPQSTGGLVCHHGLTVQDCVVLLEDVKYCY